LAADIVDELTPRGAIAAFDGVGDSELSQPKRA
jgi:hypothetical protein